MNSKSKKILKGLIKRHPDGFGFFIPNDLDHPDVFIPASSMNFAMTNDKVTIHAEKEKDGRFKGDIIRIEERAINKVAGVLVAANSKWAIIKDEGKGWGQDLKIPIDTIQSNQLGQLVVAKITQYPDANQNFLGLVDSTIGDVEDALTDIKRVLVTQNIPDEFSAETLKQAKTFPEVPDEKDFVNRKDLRKLSLITIDGATAKDFDDAVYTEMNKTGFRLIVAIADVSHYVRKNSPIDQDAYTRGTSVYFPNFVVPMLPEQLSNGLCSLNPHVPRLALVADMQFDFVGECKSSQFYEAVMESKARVTYGEAQQIIDNPDGDSETHKKFQHVKDNILRCADLAKILMAKRFKEGSLDLEVPETELLIDGTGEPIDVVKSERQFSHRLIEEMMLAANVAVAKFLANKQIPALYRTHEPPDPLKMAALEKHLKQFGSKVNLNGDKLQKKLTKALHEFKEETQAQVIHILTLRSLSQAKYTLANIGHFGLGFEYYTHFTSPIRRYPDLIVHRLIKNCIGLSQYHLMSEADIQTAGTWLSGCEQKAAKSERQIQAIKKARFMKKMLGETFEGIISSVTKFGVFVLLRQFNIDGLIRLDDLGPSNWVFDEEALKLVASRSGLSYSLGDKIQILVSHVDIESGQVNFVLEKPHQVKNNIAPDKQIRNQTKFSNKKSNQSKNFNKFAKGKPVNNKPNNQFKKPIEEKEAKGPYIVKPKYASLSDYLDQMSKKNKSSNENKQDKDLINKNGNDQIKKNKFKTNSPEKSSNKNRKNPEKRESSKNNSGGFRKTRPKKSNR